MRGALIYVVQIMSKSRGNFHSMDAPASLSMGLDANEESLLTSMSTSASRLLYPDSHHLVLHPMGISLDFSVTPRHGLLWHES